ncbi:proline-, glutamic acid- and leucine-rich protein 1-like isoform X2 [Sycon ciliatum]|uniref:proline-, glutamic acid- and leucine-rich protein 1-like isoform X2 n=1 Tax=Sycon ciliatum TaxID=27933 RepID=UPI0031F6DBC6
MNELSAVAASVTQFRNPAELANAWKGADERGARSLSGQRSIEDVEKEALQLLRGDDIAKRSSGVVLIASIAKVSTGSHFKERCDVWIQQCVSNLDKSGPEAQKGIAELLCQLLSRSSEFRELTQLVDKFISPIVDKLLRATPEWRVKALECLNTCIQCYPALCLSSKEKIINALFPMLDIGDEATQNIVAQCMASAPSIGSDGGNAATRHTEVWMLWCNMLLATLNDSLDKLVSAMEEKQVQTPLIGTFTMGPGTGGQNSEPPEKFPLEEPPENEPNRSALLLTRCQSLCACLKYLLQTAYPVAVSFPLQAILAVICRILALSNRQLVTHPSVECVLVFSALPVFYTSSLELLTAVTCSCKQMLLPQSWLINQLLLQAYGWSGGEASNHATPYSCVRIALHRQVEAWMWVIGSDIDKGSALHFVKHAMSDAKPLRKEDKINEDFALKSAKREKTAEISAADPNDIDICANAELTISALRALSAILSAAGSVLPTECHTSVRLFLIPVLLEINNAHRPSSGMPAPKGWWTAGGAPVPYGRADCRKEIYNALLSCVLAEKPGAEAMHHAIHMFTDGARDPNMEVSMTCRQAISVCNVIVRSQHSSASGGGGASASATASDTAANAARRGDAEGTVGTPGAGLPRNIGQLPPASARLLIQQSVAAQQMQLQETIRQRRNTPGGNMTSSGSMADLSQAQSSTIHGRRMKNRKGSAASSASPSEDPGETIVTPSSIAAAAEPEAMQVDSGESITLTEQQSEPCTPTVRPLKEASEGQASSTDSASPRTAGKRRAQDVVSEEEKEKEGASSMASASQHAADSPAAGEEDPPAAKKRRVTASKSSETEEAATAPSQETVGESSPQSSKEEKETSTAGSSKSGESKEEKGGDVSGMLQSFVDSGPDSDSNT